MYISDTTDDSTLKNLDEAKILVVSDSHFQKENLYSAITRHGNECNALIFLGDGIEDLAEIMEEEFFLKETDRTIPENIFFVKGNGDSARLNLCFEGETIREVTPVKTITVSGKKLMLTHGHTFEIFCLDYVQKNEENSKLTVINPPKFNFYTDTEVYFQYLKKNHIDGGFFGHTHVPFFKEQSGIFLINPGSISRPRKNSKKSYAVFTVKKHSPSLTLEFFTLDS